MALCRLHVLKLADRTALHSMPDGAQSILVSSAGRLQRRRRLAHRCRRTPATHTHHPLYVTGKWRRCCCGSGRRRSKRTVLAKIAAGDDGGDGNNDHNYVICDEVAVPGVHLRELPQKPKVLHVLSPEEDDDRSSPE